MTILRVGNSCGHTKIQETDDWLREHEAHSKSVSDLQTPWEDPGVMISCMCGHRHGTQLSKLPPELKAIYVERFSATDVHQRQSADGAHVVSRPTMEGALRDRGDTDR